jgi:hypothetical protein
VKLFQIEEPDGAPATDGPGAAVGIAIGAGAGTVAIALGGNAEILPGRDGALSLAGEELGALLLGLRERAEKQLARPVTHAVIAGAPDGDALERAAAAAGIAVLRRLDWAAAAALAKAAPSLEAAALGAALQAEDDAPRLPSG